MSWLVAPAAVVVLLALRFLVETAAQRSTRRATNEHHDRACAAPATCCGACRGNHEEDAR